MDNTLNLQNLKVNLCGIAMPTRMNYFLVVKGKLTIEFRDGAITLNEGEFYIVPKGVEHKPVADEEAHIILLEPKSTEQTGGIESDLLVDNQPWI